MSMALCSGRSRSQLAWLTGNAIRVCLRLGALLLLLVLYRSVFWPGPPGGDFVNHRIFGGRFLDNTFLYQDGLNSPYPPFWAMAHAPFALMHEWLAFAVYHALGVVALVLLLTLLPGERERRGLILFLVLIVARPFIIRDLHDGGPNLILLALTWSGLVLWSRGLVGRGAACLGLAIALKCTPAVFLVYFAMKRSWRMLAATAGMALLFTLAPMLRQGPVGYAQHLTCWVHMLRDGMRTPPGWGVLGAEEMRNCSLRAALARHLVDLPDGHPGLLVHPWRCPTLHLSMDVATAVLKLASVVLLGVVLLRVRGSGTSEFEWAAMALLMPLLSPITWGQHCVATIPALVLLVGRMLREGARHDVIVLALVSALYAIGLNRTLVNAMGAGLINSYGIVTLSLLMLLAACLCAEREPRQASG
jgi:alpha-1,2-mannosyltransferase